jgi:hypothetical protein
MAHLFVRGLCADFPLCPAPTQTICSRQYYISFIDKTRLAHLTLLRKKDEAFKAYKDFEVHLRMQYGKGIAAVNFDRGDEYMGKACVLYV